MEKLPQKQSGSLLDNKKLLVAVLFMALIFNVIFGCLRNPLGEDNTISWIGYDHPNRISCLGRTYSCGVLFKYLTYLPQIRLYGKNRHCRSLCRSFYGMYGYICQ